MQKELSDMILVVPQSNNDNNNNSTMEIPLHSVLIRTRLKGSFDILQAKLLDQIKAEGKLEMNLPI